MIAYENSMPYINPNILSMKIPNIFLSKSFLKNNLIFLKIKRDTKDLFVDKL